MKITYLLQIGSDMRHPPFDGPANHIRHVIREFKELGHTVQFLIGINGKIYQSTDLLEYQEVGLLPTDHGWQRFMERLVRKIQTILHLPYFGWFESRRFAAAVSKYIANSDLIFERLSWMGYGGTIAAKRHHLPHIIEYNGDPLHDLEAKHIAPKGLQREISKFLLKFTLTRADFLIASGNGWKSNLVDIWGIPPQKIDVIENGTDLVDLIKYEQIKNRFYLNSNSTNKVKIVYLGGFYPWHGTDNLLHCAARCKALFSDFEVILIGAGPGYEEAKQLASSLHLNQTVHFTGQLSAVDYAPILANADIGVSPYCNWIEYSGLKIFDYKAAGLAIIAAGENGHPYTLKNGKTAIIIPPCDQEQLFTAMMTLLSDPHKRQQLGENARQEAQQIHTWKITGQKIDQILTQYKK